MIFNVSAASLYGGINPRQLIPLKPPRPRIEFNYKEEGTARGDKSIRKYKMGLLKAKDAILYLYNEFIKKYNIRTPHGLPLKLLYNIIPGDLGNDSTNDGPRSVTAAIIEQGPRPYEFNVKIDYANLPPPACASNIVHETQHGLELLAGEPISESTTESKVIEAFERTGHNDIAEYTKLHTGYRV